MKKITTLLALCLILTVPFATAFSTDAKLENQLNRLIFKYERSSLPKSKSYYLKKIKALLKVIEKSKKDIIVPNL